MHRENYINCVFSKYTKMDKKLTAYQVAQNYLFDGKRRTIWWWKQYLKKTNGDITNEKIQANDSSAKI